MFFFHQNDLKNKATSNVKIYPNLSPWSLNDVKIYLTDGPFSNGVGSVNSHPSKEHIELHKLIKVSSIHKVVRLLKNNLGLL